MRNPPLALTLAIVISDERAAFVDLYTPIDYTKVPVRDELTIEMEFSIYHGREGGDHPVQIPAFQTVARLLPPTPPNEMRIRFDVSVLQFDAADSARGCIADVHSEIYHPSFPNYLENVTSKAPGIGVYILLIVTVQVDYGVTYGSTEVYRAHEKYLLDQFACLSGMRGVTFCVDVYEAEDLDEFRLQYSDLE